MGFKMKHLLLCRHAKSSWKDKSLADIKRPLNKRGKRDASLMADRLSRLGVKPDAMLSSPASRARKTARHLAKGLGFARKRIIVIDKLYDASPDILFEMIRCFDKTLKQVMMIGHNPGITILADMLADFNIDHVPTCGIVALDFDVRSWPKINEKQGICAFFEYPGKFDDQ